MKKNEQLTFIALLAAVFCLLSMTLALVLPTRIEINGSVDADLPAVQTVQTTVPATTLPAVVTPPTTQPSGDSDEATTAPTTEKADDSALPQGNEAILAKYTELVNKAKTDAPGFTKVEYQEIPPEKAQFEGSLFNKILPIASNFFTDEETARANAEPKAKGDSMEWFPIYKNAKGCLLTDASAIENATCTELPDGNVKISIELKDEINCEPAEDAATWDSPIGSMFTPIKMADVRNTLETDPAVKFIVKNVDFELKYHDCVLDLVYNPANDQLVSLDQYMHILITINEGTLLGMSAKGNAILNNYMYISDFVY